MTTTHAPQLGLLMMEPYALGASVLILWLKLLNHSLIRLLNGVPKMGFLFQWTKQLLYFSQGNTIFIPMN